MAIKCQLFQIGYSTWESTLTIESVYNSHYTTYQCLASNDLGEDEFNISLTTKSTPEPPVNLEVSMKDYKTVQLKVSCDQDTKSSGTSPTVS